MKFLPKNIDYLRIGNKRQSDAYLAINELNIFNILEKFNPILAGTIPLEIDIDSSDLDLICESSDLLEFQSTLKFYFGNMDSFDTYIPKVRDIPTIVATFKFYNFTFEIFCQSVPVENQFAVIHLKIEERLLRLSGDHVKEKIRNLKKQGMKTELAFATYFKIKGDPYEELAKMADYTDQQLIDMIDKIFQS